MRKCDVSAHRSSDATRHCASSMRRSHTMPGDVAGDDDARCSFAHGGIRSVSFQSQKNDRQEILRKLAMGADDEAIGGGGFEATSKPLKKTPMQVSYVVVASYASYVFDAKHFTGL